MGFIGFSIFLFVLAVISWVSVVRFGQGMASLALLFLIVGIISFAIGIIIGFITSFSSGDWREPLRLLVFAIIVGLAVYTGSKR